MMLLVNILLKLLIITYGIYANIFAEKKRQEAFAFAKAKAAHIFYFSKKKQQNTKRQHELDIAHVTF